MTDKEAIERLKICVDCGDCLTCKAHDNAIELAIQALQEREERARGCDYCTDGGNPKSLLFREGPCSAMDTDIYVGKEAIICDYGCHAYDVIDINFCPMCGMKLKEEPQ